MKFSPVLKKISIALFCASLATSLQAQDHHDHEEGHDHAYEMHEPKGHKKGRELSKEAKQARKAFHKSLTDIQKQDLKAIKELRKSHRETLRATFTQKQLNIKDDETLMRREKRQALKGTFSQSQLDLIKKYRAEMKSSRDAFKATLSQEQIALRQKFNNERPARKRRKGMDRE